MDDRALVARLHRRAGFGLDAAGLTDAAGRGPATEAARLADPVSAGLPAPPDPFAGLDLAFVKGDGQQRLVAAVDAWLTRMGTTAWAGRERLAWFWHGHFVSAAPKVKSAALLADQLRVVWSAGAGPFPALVRALTLDPAMLLYLDGSGSTSTTPNENYGRELMELFTLGRTGGYTEADVQAAARALTGYRVTEPKGAAPTVVFVPRNHDDAAETLLGLGGVHDVDTVVKAVTGHPSCASFVAAKLTRAWVGPDAPDAAVGRATERFRSSGLDAAALQRAVLDELLAGVDGGPVVLAPVPWLVHAERACGVRLAAKVRAGGLRAAGQVPFVAPNVGGWPSGEAWFGSATVVARTDLAAALAAAVPADAPALVAAGGADAAGFAAALGLGAPFGPATARSLAAVAAPRSRLVLALVSPEFVLA